MACHSKKLKSCHQGCNKVGMWDLGRGNTIAIIIVLCFYAPSTLLLCGLCRCGLLEVVTTVHNCGFLEGPQVHLCFLIALLFCKTRGIHNLCPMNISTTYLLDNHVKEHLRCRDVQCHIFLGCTCQGSLSKDTKKMNVCG